MSQKAIALAVLVFMSTHFVLFGQNEADIASFESFFYNNDQLSPERVVANANMRLEQAREIRDSREEARAMKVLGLVHLTRLHNYEKAMDFFIRSLAIEDSLNLESERVLTYIAIARVFEVVGDYYKSAEFLEQGLALNRDQRNINSDAMILNNLGKVNASRERVEEAFKNYEQVLKYKADIEKHFEAEALYNLGQLYTFQGKYSEALQDLKRALAINREEKDRYREALSLNDIGEVYRLMKNDEKSLANHLVALEIRQALQDKSGIAESYNHIGWLYYRQNNMERAIENGLLALEHGREAQAQEQMFQSYELLSLAHKEKEDYKNALMYKELSLAIREFIQNEKQERQVLETQNRYVIGKKETQIKNLDAVRIDREKQIASHKQLKNILFLLVGMVFIIAVLIFVLYLVKRRSNRILRQAKDEVQKQNIKLQELNHTKDKFFSIISHDLKGPLNSLTSFSHLLIAHTENLSRQEIQMLATDLDKSVKNLFALLENLLEWSRSQTGNIDFTPEVFDLTEMLESNKNLLQSLASTKHIGIAVEANGPCPVKLHKQSINTVVRNLVSNAIKFTEPGGNIRLGFNTRGNRLHVFVRDNGVGIGGDVIKKLFRLDIKHSSQGTAKEKGTGLGLILCKEFIEKNGGRINVESEPGKGSVFSFSFPLTVMMDPVSKISQPVVFLE